jgi:hypothetical protein
MSTDRLRQAPRNAALCAGASLVFLLLLSAPAHSQGEGARAYILGPVPSQALNVYGMFGRGNASFNPGSVVTAGGEVDVNGGIIEYAHSFALAGEAGSWLVTLPFGAASRSISVGSASRTDSRSGIGDMQLTAAFGLLGSPALSEKDYETYRPRFAVTLLTRLYIPTGEYDRTSPVNLGQNRWALQLGLPLAYYFGESFSDVSLTSLELIPSVIWYGDNNEPASGNRSSQAPLIQLEGHLTRNLNESWWVALDSIFIQGGETTTDGVSDHNRQRSFALGATVSVAVSDTLAATLSYTEEVSRNRNGVGGRALRLIAEFSL